MGGALAALDAGYQVREIQEAAYKHQMMVESGQKAIIGVNQFVTDNPPVSSSLRIDPAQTQAQIARLQEVRAKRDSNRAQKALKELDRVARSTENTVPALMEAAEAYCTIGEICDTFRAVFGEQGHTAAI